MKQLTADAILHSVHGLPALPAVVLELIQSFGDSDVSAEQLAIKISHDQAIAAKTLRLANSSFYGLPRQVTSITEATAILGLRTLGKRKGLKLSRALSCKPFKRSML